MSRLPLQSMSLAIRNLANLPSAFHGDAPSCVESWLFVLDDTQTRRHDMVAEHAIQWSVSCASRTVAGAIRFGRTAALAGRNGHRGVFGGRGAALLLAGSFCFRSILADAGMDARRVVGCGPGRLCVCGCSLVEPLGLAQTRPPRVGHARAKEISQAR